MPSLRIGLITVVVVCLVLGAIVGFLAGLLGIGGGIFIVPVLSILLHKLAIVNVEEAFMVAVATSLASIIFTSFSSAWTHHRFDNVNWRIAVWAIVSVAIGAGLSSFLAGMVSTQWLKTMFAVTVVVVAAKMAFSPSPIQTQFTEHPNRWILVLVCVLIGALSGLIGIGGGVLVVPLLSYLKFDVKKAIGVASVAGTCIAIVATVGYVTTGWRHFTLADGFLGYVYLPALIGLIMTSSIAAPFGAKMVHKLPIKVIKRIFAGFLFMVVLKMLLA